MSEEVIEVVTDPPGNLAQDQMQQRSIQHMLNTAQFVMGTVAHELKTDLPRASAIMLSVLTTTVMVFIRGYPRETWAPQFREVAQYFERMAVQIEDEEIKGAEHDNPTN
jgi:hypothetical protein